MKRRSERSTAIQSVRSKLFWLHKCDKERLGTVLSLWKQYDAQNPDKAYGTMVSGKHWHYYESWVELVRKHCMDNKMVYK
jgi:hypothetical protein